MAKWFKALTAYLLCAVIAAVSVTVGGIFTADKADGAPIGVNEQYISELTDIYRQYDPDDYEALDKSNPYALKRLLVCGYNGNSYGAVQVAYDAENDYAVLQYDSEEAAKAAQEQLLAEDAIVEPDSVGELDAGKGTMSPVGSEMIGTPQYLNSYAMNSDDVLVAIVDTGVMYDHIRLAGRFYNNGYDLSGDGKENAYYDTARQGEYFGHGTFVAGVLADNTPDTVQFVPFKVASFGDGVSFTASAVQSAINQAVNMGAEVINVSLGTTAGEGTFRNVVNNAVKKGVCVCCAAGNSAKELNSEYKRFPACVENAITVSAVDNEKTYTEYTNWGTYIDFAAPGNSIVSTYPGENGASVLVRWSGTSFSSPYIAALCADIKTIDKELSVDDVYQTLCDFAEDLGEEGRDVYYGNGLPYLGNMVYTDGTTYEYKIPQGTLEVYQSAEYTQDSQPWKRFASKILSVSVSDTVTEVGDYMFCNMSSATFTMPATYHRVGDYAFYNCQLIPSMTFDIDVAEVGYKAFGNIADFSVTGYRNTPAEEYAISENIPFYELGCKHNYVFDTVEPTDTEEGYTIYTCTVCGNQYTGPYIRPSTVATGVCGDTMRYRLYSNGMLLIYGSGKMYDYFAEDAPWSEYKDSIRVLNIYSNIEEISPYAFQHCKNIGRITVHEQNEWLSTDGTSLYNFDQSELLYTTVRGELVLPDTVSALRPQALVAVPGVKLQSNAHLTVENSLVYDESGNLLAALSSYNDSTLLIHDNIHIQDNAFMLTRYPSTLEAYCTNLTIGTYGIGYYYDGSGMVKESLTVKTLQNTPAADYATENEFTLITDNIDMCGDDIIWTYDSKLRKLTLYGSGAMYEYESAEDIPWYSVMSGLKEVVIDENITLLSSYAFNQSSLLESLTLPISLGAPHDNTIWENCTALKSVHVTQGTGRSDDYEDADGTMYYVFTPWYLSRSTITDFQLDENVRYIGKSMFRACYGIKELTLRQPEEIADNAFMACRSLKTVTMYSRDTVFGSNALFVFKTGTNYSNTKLYGYIHATSQDYAEAHGAEFIPLDALIGSVTTKSNAPFEGLQIYLDDTLITSTDANGEFIADTVIDNGYYTLSVKTHGAVIFESPVTINDEQVRAVIKLRYADFVKDNVINAKDYAFALRRGYDDGALFDYGKVESGENIVRIHKTKI